MKFISREMLIKILKVSSCASDDTARKMLNAVRIERSNDKYSVLAVDGHCLSSLEAGFHNEKFMTLLEENETLILSTFALPRIELLLRTYPKHKTFPCELSELFLKVEVQGDVFTLKLATEEFPDVTKVIPELNENYYSVMFNPDVFRRISAAIKPDKYDKACVLHIHKEDQHKPIIVETSRSKKKDNSFGVLMPMHQ